MRALQFSSRGDIGKKVGGGVGAVDVRASVRTANMRMVQTVTARPVMTVSKMRILPRRARFSRIAA